MKNTRARPFGLPLAAFAALLVAILSALPIDAQEKPNQDVLSAEEMRRMLHTIDERQRNAGDHKTLAYIEHSERGKDTLIYEAAIYRRDRSNKFMIMFLRPKAETGKGYLSVDGSLFMYDPTIGKWERRTERDRIGGTGSQRADFDKSRLAEQYMPQYVAPEKLGRFSVHHLVLTATENAGVAYPTLHLWIDAKTGNVLKQQEIALSGRLMRTLYYARWGKVFSENKKADVYFPKEIRIFDEVDVEKSTTIVLESIDLRPLAANIFTKAWFESKSR